MRRRCPKTVTVLFFLFSVLFLSLTRPVAQTSDSGALFGQLEGPTVVTDPALFPKTFQEAPQLATLVRDGKLPPVRERIGEDPMVIKPLHEMMCWLVRHPWVVMPTRVGICWGGMLPNIIFNNSIRSMWEKKR